MTPKDIRQFADDALTLRKLLIQARQDPTLSPEEREEYDALMQLCTGCLVLTDTMRDTLKKGEGSTMITAVSGRSPPSRLARVRINTTNNNIHES